MIIRIIPLSHFACRYVYMYVCMYISQLGKDEKIVIKILHCSLSFCC